MSTTKSKRSATKAGITGETGETTQPTTTATAPPAKKSRKATTTPIPAAATTEETTQPVVTETQSRIEFYYDDCSSYKISDIPAIEKDQIKGPVSILKVRKLAANNLYESLTSNGKNKDITNLISTKNELELLLTNYNTNLQIYDAVKDTTDEGEDDENIPRQGSANVVSGRSALSDSTAKLLALDIIMFKLIYSFYKIIKTEKNLNPKSVEGLNYVVSNFIRVSSCKEYLDVGQLYAIIDLTVNNNIDWTHSKIKSRINFIRGAGSETASESNNVINYAQLRKPRKPMLETHDGAATRIAANAGFTVYCANKISKYDFIQKKEITTLKDGCYYIDDKNVFLLCLLFSTDLEISNAVNQKFQMDSTIKIIKNLGNNDTDDLKIIDCLYNVICSNGGLSNLKSISNALLINNKVLIVLHKAYYLASVAVFLAKQNGILSPDGLTLNQTQSDQTTRLEDNVKQLKNNLINMNFDSLCHDNKLSNVYRFIMILMVLIKNDNDQVKKQIKEMGLSLEDNNYDLPKLNGVDEIKPQTEDFYKYLNDDFKIFNALSKTATKVSCSEFEDNCLSRRLMKKSCYVFPISSGVCSDHVALSIFQNSSHIAYQTTTDELNKLQFDPSNKFPISSLHSAMMIPEYSNCAIDLPLPSHLSLSRVNALGIDSFDVWVTPVTQNDAAAQIMRYSRYDGKPTCMEIPIAKSILTTNDKNERYEFLDNKMVYKFVGDYNDFLAHNKPSYEEAKPKITECPTEFKNLCPYYFNLISNIDNLKYSKSDIILTDQEENQIYEQFYNMIKTPNSEFNINNYSFLPGIDYAHSDSKQASAINNVGNSYVRYFEYWCGTKNKPGQGIMKSRNEKAKLEFINEISDIFLRSGEYKNVLLYYLLLRIFMNISINITNGVNQKNIKKILENNMKYCQTALTKLNQRSEKNQTDERKLSDWTAMEIEGGSVGGSLQTDPFVKTTYDCMFGRFGFDVGIYDNDGNDEEIRENKFEIKAIDTFTDHAKYLIKYQKTPEIEGLLNYLRNTTPSELVELHFLDVSDIDGIINTIQQDVNVANALCSKYIEDNKEKSELPSTPPVQQFMTDNNGEQDKLYNGLLALIEEIGKALPIRIPQNAQIVEIENVGQLEEISEDSKARGLYDKFYSTIDNLLNIMNQTGARDALEKMTPILSHGGSITSSTDANQQSISMPKQIVLGKNFINKIEQLKSMYPGIEEVFDVVNKYNNSVKIQNAANPVSLGGTQKNRKPRKNRYTRRPKVSNKNKTCKRKKIKCNKKRYTRK